MEITILGSGSSAGTPVIGCDCATCTSADRRNNRTRASVYVTINGANVLIDTGPDFRLQALREKLHRVDAVLYTHQHADHLNGIDDLRAFCYRQRAAIPIFGSAFTLKDIQARFGYCFFPPSEYWERPVLTAHVVTGGFTFQDIAITPLPVLHGKWPILGYRIGNFAYITDVSEIPAETRHLLEGVDVLLLDCLRRAPHFNHFGFDQAIENALKINAAMTYLIHMTHELEYGAMTASLPDNIRVGYDGLRIDL